MDDVDLRELYTVYTNAIEMMNIRGFTFEETEGLYLEDLQEYVDDQDMTREEIYKKMLSEEPESIDLCRIPTHTYIKDLPEFIKHFTDITSTNPAMKKDVKYQHEIADELRIYFMNGEKRAMVYFFPLDVKLSQANMEYVHSLVTRDNVHTLVIIAKKQPTPKVSGVLGIMGSNAQIFLEHEMYINPTKHQLVPPHILVSDPDERTRILEFYSKSPKDGKARMELFPALFTNDPVAKYYGFKPDDLVEIRRPRRDGYYNISYRVVTHPVTDNDKK